MEVTSSVSSPDHAFAHRGLELDIYDENLPARDVPEGDGTHDVTMFGTLANNMLRRDAAHVVPEGNSLFIFSNTNPFRLKCVFLVNNIIFQYCVISLIILNAVSMAATDPTLTLEQRENDTWQSVLYYFDLGCLSFYVIELALKCIACGAFFGERCFWVDPWNKLDLVVVFCSWLGWIGTRGGFKGPTRGANALRVFRAIKPLRVVKSLPAVRAILDSLSNSIPLLASTTLLFCFFFLTFSIVALEFYQESLSRRCVVAGEYITPTFLGSNVSTTGSTPTVTLLEGRETISPTWCNADKTFGVKCQSPEATCSLVEAPYEGVASFDNMASSCLVLFQVMTLDSWSFYLYALGDAENWLWTLFFFVALIVLISFVVINLFLAVIHTTFVEVRQEQQRSAFLDTETAKQVQEANKVTDEDIINRIADREEDEPCCAPFHLIQRPVAALIDSKAFEIGVNVCIVLSVALQTFEASGLDAVHDMNSFFDISEAVFIGIFIVEILLRMVKFGTIPAFFRKDSWNTFDLLIVVLAFVGLVAGNTSLRFLRAFRLLRLVRLVKDFEGLQRLLAAAVAGILPTFNVLVFALFILFVFACMGMSLFGGHFNRHNEPNSPFRTDANNKAWLSVVDRLNFDQFDTAFILLFQIMTGDNWSLFMWYSMNIDIPVPWIQATTYFVVYYFISGLIVLSLFTVVILENFELSQEEKQKATQRLRKNIEKNMRVGIQARRSLGLSVVIPAREANLQSFRTSSNLGLDPALAAIKNRVASFVSRKKSLAPLKLPISSLQLFIAQHNNTGDLENVHDILDEGLESLDASLHDQNMLDWIAAAHTLLSSMYIFCTSQCSAFIHNLLVKTVKAELQCNILQTFESQLIDSLQLSRRTLISLLDAEWSGTKTDGLVRQLSMQGKAPGQDAVSNLSTMAVYEVCLAEKYARDKIIGKQEVQRASIKTAIAKDWDILDLHVAKIQAMTRRYIIKKNLANELNLLRQERTMRELIVDCQHSDWHDMALSTHVAAMPALEKKVRDKTWTDPTQEANIAPQKYYKGLHDFKEMYSTKDDLGVDVTALAAAELYEVEIGVCTFRDILRMVMEGDFVAASHNFMRLDKSTLEEAVVRTRNYAKEALRINTATFADIYLRSAYNMSLAIKEGNDAASVSTAEQEYYVAMPCLLLPPVPQLSQHISRSTVIRTQNVVRWVNPDLTMAKEGYCALCTHYAVHGDTVSYTTASRVAALPAIERSPRNRDVRKPSVSFATDMIQKQIASSANIFGASPPGSPTSFSTASFSPGYKSPGYRSPPGGVHDDVFTPLPQSPTRRRRSLNNVADSKESLIRELTGELVGNNVDNPKLPTAPDGEDDEDETPDAPDVMMKELDAKSFGIFDPGSSVRMLCSTMSNSLLFNLFITLVIIGSSIVVLWQPTPEAWDKTPTIPEWMRNLELAFIGVFVSEALIKMCAMTFYSAGDDSYIADSWNKLDFLVLWCQVLAHVLPTVRGLGLVKALRPLRLISQIEGLQVVLGALLASLKTFVNVFIAGTFGLFLCALFGYHLFHDRFDKCTHPGWTGGESKDNCVGDVVTSIDDISYLVPVAWIKAQAATFDTIQAAMAACLEISSLSSWSTLAYQSMDITSIGRQPQTNHSKWAIIYYIIVITVCTLFLVNLFIGVIITNINTHRGMELMDDRQQEWALLNRTIALVRLPVVIERPRGRVRSVCYDIAGSYWFLKAVLGVIVANIIVMASSHRSEPGWWYDTRQVLNYVFLTVYVVEMVIKLLAYGPKYFADHWNKFDFVIVWGSILSIAYGFIVGGQTLTVLSVARIFRIGRIFRIARRFKGVATMFHTLLVSLPQILNISLMMLLLVFIYTVVGMNYFSHIKFQYNLNKNANFRSFSSALSIVFRMVTLDDWNKVMRDCTVQPPHCTFVDGFDDCGSRWAFVYFFSFFIIGSYIFLNLVIAVILDNFTHTFSRSKQHITDYDITVFTESWMEFDPKGLGYIPKHQLSSFTLSLFKNNCSIAVDSCFHPVEFSMRYKALLYELDLLASEKGKNAKFQFLFRKTAPDAGVPVAHFEDVLMVMCRAYHGFPGLSFDELNERAGKEVFWEVCLGVGVLARATKQYLGLKKAKQQVNNPEKWAALERIRSRLQVIQQAITATQQERLQVLYAQYARARYELEDRPTDDAAGHSSAWTSELERVPREGAWSPISLASVYSPPCRMADYQAGQQLLVKRRSSSFRL